MPRCDVLSCSLLFCILLCHIRLHSTVLACIIRSPLRRVSRRSPGVPERLGSADAVLAERPRALCLGAGPRGQHLPGQPHGLLAGLLHRVRPGPFRSSGRAGVVLRVVSRPIAHVEYCLPFQDLVGANTKSTLASALWAANCPTPPKNNLGNRLLAPCAPLCLHGARPGASEQRRSLASCAVPPAKMRSSITSAALPPAPWVCSGLFCLQSPATPARQQR